MSMCIRLICDDHKTCVLLATFSVSGDKFGMWKGDDEGSMAALAFVSEHLGCRCHMSEDPPDGYTETGPHAFSQRAAEGT